MLGWIGVNNMDTKKYDSRPDTYRHIQQVQALLFNCIAELMRRAEMHDQSKLTDPEVALFDEYTPSLAECTYGSDEYKQMLAGLKPALDHHYAKNRHHPEHFDERGIRGMNLIDVLEMLCDWKAATLRHHDGDIRKSIEINQKRFGFSDELRYILLNTLMVIDENEPDFSQPEFQNPQK